MRAPTWDSSVSRGPNVDEVPFEALYSKSEYRVRTADGWTLVLTRYQPKPQTFQQPLCDEPVLLVHGFSQNRHAWTAGEFVKNLLFFGLDVHIVELRGHGKSSLELQRRYAREAGCALPADLDYGWDLDSYFIHDIPTAVAAVKHRTGRERIFYCGHSMGGILGYGYAGLHHDLDGLVTIGAPADLGRGFPLLKLLATALPAAEVGLDAALGLVNTARKILPGDGAAPLSYRRVPVNSWLAMLESALEHAERRPLYDELVRRVNWLSNPKRVSSANIRWLLREGAEPEPRGVVAQFARWVRNGELRCEKLDFNFRQGFANLRLPMAIIFGDRDPLASVASTRAVYEAAQSDYLLWRPVKGNSHIELTMGHDIRQICYDVKNLVEYAVRHRDKGPSLPRLV
jgi:pimeloyl-ACP methyl ester carboxylesterase